MRFLGRILAAGGLSSWDDESRHGNDPPLWMTVVCAAGAWGVLCLAMLAVINLAAAWGPR